MSALLKLNGLELERKRAESDPGSGCCYNSYKKRRSEDIA